MKTRILLLAIVLMALLLTACDDGTPEYTDVGVGGDTVWRWIADCEYGVVCYEHGFYGMGCVRMTQEEIDEIGGCP